MVVQGSLARRVRARAGARATCKPVLMPTRGDAGRALLWYGGGGDRQTWPRRTRPGCWIVILMSERWLEIRAPGCRFHRLASLDGGGDGAAAARLLNGALVVPPGVVKVGGDDTTSDSWRRATRAFLLLQGPRRRAPLGRLRDGARARRGAPDVQPTGRLNSSTTLYRRTERMRWPVFLARAQLRKGVAGRGAGSSLPTKRVPTAGQVGVAVLVVIDVVRAVTAWWCCPVVRSGRARLAARRCRG